MAAAPDPAWVTSLGAIPLDRPRVLGILNVTPDSFFDGGLHAGVEAAVAHAAQLVAEGVDILDLGGESTRPGARPIPAAEELERVLPVLRELTKRFPDVPVSVDTVKADVARVVLAEGACIINDVSGLRLDPALAEVVAASGAGVVLMHSRGDVGEMASYATAIYGPDPVGDVVRELADRLEHARSAGIADDAVVLDPGLGFSKRTEHSLGVLAHLDRVLALGRPVLLGPSRKRFVGEAGGGLAPADRLEGTIAACLAGALAGARLFRVHDVAPVQRALAVAEAIRRAP